MSSDELRLRNYGNMDELVTPQERVPIWRDPERLTIVLFAEVSLLILLVIIGVVYGISQSNSSFNEVIETQDCIADELLIAVPLRDDCSS